MAALRRQGRPLADPFVHDPATHHEQQIIHLLREAEIKLDSGKTTSRVCRELGNSEQSSQAGVSP